MVYVKHFDILGIDTAQIPCIELQGPPNAATEGAVGLLGMDVTSDGREIYVCTAVNGAIYTWESLKDGKDGTCIVKAEINDINELILTLSDGKVLNAGVVKGTDGKDGEDGKNGTDGISVVDTQLNDNGELIVSFSDGTEKNVGVVVGEKGEDGVSIINTQINDDYQLIITLSNGTIMNLGSIKSDYVAEADHATNADNAERIGGTAVRYVSGNIEFYNPLNDKARKVANSYMSDIATRADDSTRVSGWTLENHQNEFQFTYSDGTKYLRLVGRQRIDYGGSSSSLVNNPVSLDEDLKRPLVEGDRFEVLLYVSETDPSDSSKEIFYRIPLPCCVVSVDSATSTHWGASITKIVSTKVGEYRIEVTAKKEAEGKIQNISVSLAERSERFKIAYVERVYLMPTIYTETQHNYL